MEDGKKLEVPCRQGTLVAEYFGDPGVYDGIAVDLVRPDGKGTQCCIVETTPEGELHVLAWDGEHEEYVTEQVVDPRGAYVY